MSQQNESLQISDSRLQANYSRSRESMWTEIGEAQVTHNIFGRAKVRIVRKNDTMRRVMWWTGIVAVALAAAAWQGWLTIPHDSEPASVDALPPPAPKVHVSEPVAQPNISVPPVVQPQAQSQTAVPEKPLMVQKSVPQAAVAPKAPLPPSDLSQAAKPVTPQPLKTNNSLPASQQPVMAKASAPVAAGALPTTVKPPLPVAPRSVPPVAVKPTAPTLGKPVGVQAASSPAAAMPMASPLAKEVSPAPVPDKKLSDPVNTPQ